MLVLLGTTAGEALKHPVAPSSPMAHACDQAWTGCTPCLLHFAWQQQKLGQSCCSAGDGHAVRRSVGLLPQHHAPGGPRDLLQILPDYGGSLCCQLGTVLLVGPPMQAWLACTRELAGWNKDIVFAFHAASNFCPPLFCCQVGQPGRQAL